MTLNSKSGCRFVAAHLDDYLRTETWLQKGAARLPCWFEWLVWLIAPLWVVRVHLHIRHCPSCQWDASWREAEIYPDRHALTPQQLEDDWQEFVRRRDADELNKKEHP